MNKKPKVNSVADCVYLIILFLLGGGVGNRRKWRPKFVNLKIRIMEFSTISTNPPHWRNQLAAQYNPPPLPKILLLFIIACLLFFAFYSQPAPSPWLIWTFWLAVQYGRSFDEEGVGENLRGLYSGGGGKKLETKETQINSVGWQHTNGIFITKMSGRK